MKKIASIAMLISCTFALQGCVAAVIGAGVATTKVATDPRTAGKQVDDTSLDTKFSFKLKEEKDYFKQSRIVSSAYNGDMLLIGQTQSKQVSDRATELAQQIPDIGKVYNEVRTKPVISSVTIAQDTWITTKVKSSLISEKMTKARDIKVVTEDGEVFLMGILSHSEGRIAAETASKISGVKLVTTIFNYND